MLKNTNLLPPAGASIICLNEVDSSNNYAMARIDAGLSAHGDLIVAERQTAGRGQRGRNWIDQPGESLLMSLIAKPTTDLQQQALFLAAVAVAVAGVVQDLVPTRTVSIKWPNDILIADKKAAGILIENVIRGHSWQWAVIGIGLNVAQEKFPAGIPNATSIRMQQGIDVNLITIAEQLRANILEAITQTELINGNVLVRYNELLHRHGCWQSFRQDNNLQTFMIIGMDESGMLWLEDQSGNKKPYAHGTLEWIWT